MLPVWIYLADNLLYLSFFFASTSVGSDGFSTGDCTVEMTGDERSGLVKSQTRERPAFHGTTDRPPGRLPSSRDKDAIAGSNYMERLLLSMLVLSRYWPNCAVKNDQPLYDSMGSQNCCTTDADMLRTNSSTLRMAITCNVQCSTSLNSSKCPSHLSHTLDVFFWSSVWPCWVLPLHINSARLSSVHQCFSVWPPYVAKIASNI